MIQLYAIRLDPDKTTPGELDIDRQPGYVFAWLHPNGKKAYTLAIHRCQLGSPDRWRITHVHSGMSCDAKSPLVMRETNPPAAHLIAEACKHMDAIADRLGLAEVEKIFNTAEFKPPTYPPVAIEREADARKVKP